MNDIITFDNQASFLKWLKANHDTSSGVWLRLAKKGVTPPTVTYMEAIDVALCFGWIDGQKKPHSAEHWLQRFSPRGPRSIWSAINKAKVLVLIDAGKMQPSGLAAIETAKSNGRWDAAYEGSNKIEVPMDLQTAMDANKKANAFFKTLSAQNRFAILFRIGNVKKAETRARNIAKFVAMLEQGKTIYP